MTPAATLDTAIEHHQSGDLERARELYRAILDRNPDDPAALHGLGAVCYQSDDYDDAVGHLSRAVFLADRDAIYRNTLGLTYRAQGHLDKACWQYRAALELDPKNQGIQRNLDRAWSEWLERDRDEALSFLEGMAHFYHRAGFENFAERLYRKEIEHDANSADGWHGLGLIAHNRGEHDRAIALIDKALGLEPKNATFHHNLALSYAEKGRLLEALQANQNSLHCDFHLLAPRQKFDALVDSAIAVNAELLQRVITEGGQHWERRGNVRLAQLLYQKLVEKFPDEPKYRYDLGRTCFLQDESYEAIQNFLKATELKPDEAEYRRALAMAHRMHSLPSEALRHLSAALDLEPDNAQIQQNFNLVVTEILGYYHETMQVHYDLGDDRHVATLEYEAGNFARRHTGKVKTAMRYYDRALALVPDYAEVHRTLAEIYLEEKNYDAAIESIHHAIQAKPDDAAAYRLFGDALAGQGKVERAIGAYERSLGISKGNDAPTLGKLANLLSEQQQHARAIELFNRALSLDGKIAELHWNLGCAYERMGKTEETLTFWRQALNLDNGYGGGESYYRIALKFNAAGKKQEAILGLQKAIELKPDYSMAYWNLCEILSMGNLAMMREVSLKYYDNVSGHDRVMAALMVMKSHVNSGVSHVAIDMLKRSEADMLEMLDRADINQGMRLYLNMMFDLPHIRDDVPANAALVKKMADVYMRYLDAKALADDHYAIDFPRDTTPNRPLRIGFMSKHFRRHSVGWLSVNIIEELVKITPHVFLYVTGDMKRDHLSERFDKAAERFYHPEKTPNSVEYLKEISKDKLDVLVDMDSVTVMPHLDILHRHPAPLCLTWLGFDAPYLSPKHYYFGDRYTHPEGVDEHYIEQVVRLPDSFAAIAGLPIANQDRETVRKSMRIAPNQVAYLCVATGNKFCPEMVSAQIEILKRVPDSLLLYKGRVGDLQAIEQQYKDECAKQGVRTNRIRVLPRTPTEEEHRLIYQFADVLIDSYPYSGATHVAEALWFDMPVVAKVADQSFGRQAYSLIKAAGSDMGITFDWKTYIETAVEFGLDAGARQKMRSQLERGKRPESLAPLWNPAKFARDMHDLFEKLLPLQEE
ncbi:MAG: tetratricopeptide repeat protein [Geitlerinemataceae cyanobacterium]